MLGTHRVRHTVGYFPAVVTFPSRPLLDLDGTRRKFHPAPVNVEPLGRHCREHLPPQENHSP